MYVDTIYKYIYYIIYPKIYHSQWLPFTNGHKTITVICSLCTIST